MAGAAACVLASLGFVAYAVSMRYFANRPEPWVDEIVGYVLVASVMLAIADALRKGEHICVDIVTEKLPPRGQRIVHGAGLIAVMAVAAILMFEGWETVAFSRMVGIRSIGYLNVPIWTVQALVPIGGVLLFVTALGEMLRLATGAAPSSRTKDIAARMPTASGLD